MTFSDNPNFLFPQDLDLENKLFLPTSRLFSQLSLQLHALYQDIRATLVDFHASMASSARQLYDQPGATLTAWYDQAARRSDELYARITEELLPKVEASYQQLVVDVTDAGRETQLYLQNFLENPEAVAAEAIAPVMSYLNAATEASEEALLNSFYALSDLFNLFMEQPTETLESTYYYLLSQLLDLYSQAVSSLLVQI